MPDRSSRGQRRSPGRLRRATPARGERLLAPARLPAYPSSPDRHRQAHPVAGRRVGGGARRAWARRAAARSRSPVTPTWRPSTHRPAPCSRLRRRYQRPVTLPSARSRSAGASGGGAAGAGGATAGRSALTGGGILRRHPIRSACRADLPCEGAFGDGGGRARGAELLHPRHEPWLGAAESQPAAYEHHRRLASLRQVTNKPARERHPSVVPDAPGRVQQPVRPKPLDDLRREDALGDDEVGRPRRDLT